MTAKNAEGYPDPTAEEAIRHVMRGGKLDYTSFRTYEELQDYTIEHSFRLFRLPGKHNPPGHAHAARCRRQIRRRY